jgi:tetratricopeptide (TPR) repeat protein
MVSINSAKLNDDSQKVIDYFDKAIKLDSTIQNKNEYAKKAAEIAMVYKGKGNLSNAANWFEKVISLKTKPSNIDYYNAGQSFYNLQNFSKSDSLFTLYTNNFPKDNIGYLWSYRSKTHIDTTGDLVVPVAIELVKVAESIDSVKWKKQIIEASDYLVRHYANKKSDYASSLQWVYKILNLDPGNLDALKNKEILEKRLASPPVKK